MNKIIEVLSKRGKEIFPFLENIKDEEIQCSLAYEILNFLDSNTVKFLLKNSHSDIDYEICIAPIIYGIYLELHEIPIRYILSNLLIYTKGESNIEYCENVIKNYKFSSKK